MSYLVFQTLSLIWSETGITARHAFYEHPGIDTSTPDCASDITATHQNNAVTTFDFRPSKSLPIVSLAHHVAFTRCIAKGKTHRILRPGKHRLTCVTAIWRDSDTGPQDPAGASPRTISAGSQAARDAHHPVDPERDVLAGARHPRLPGCWQNVSMQLDFNASFVHHGPMRLTPHNAGSYRRRYLR